MKRVFCIGNGESRRGVNLDLLRPYGKIYGCNALYRDYKPDAQAETTDVTRDIAHHMKDQFPVSSKYLLDSK